MSAPRKSSDRRLVYCLLCQKPQKYISTHLVRRCMAGKPETEIKEELRRAKRSMKAWTSRGRRWDYHQLRQWCPEPAGRYSLFKYLQENNFFIINPPDEEELSTMEEAVTLTEESAESTVSSAEESGTSTEPESRSASEEEPAQSGPTRQTSRYRVQKGARKSMRHMGMYKQVASDDPLLVRYRAHLGGSLKIVKSKQEIANVSRWLRFLMPDAAQVSVEFARCIPKMEEYVRKLKDAQLSMSTICQSVANFLRFTRFVKDLSSPEEAADCDLFIKALSSVIQTLRSEDKQGKSPKLVVRTGTSLQRCQRVLCRAEEEIQNIYKNLDEGCHVTEEEKTRYRYYCEAVLLLRLCQRPSVVENLTAKEWLERNEYGGFVIVVHHVPGKTTSSFALSESDATLFDTYFTKIRAGYLQDRDVEDTRFFLTQSGSTIKSAHVELSRLHRHYNVPNISSQDVRKVLAREANILEEEMKASVRVYLGLSEADDGSSHTPLSSEQVVSVACVIDTMASSSEGVKTPKRRRESSVEEGTDLGAFFQMFPVSLDGKAPSKKKRVEAGFSPERTLYDKWRSTQFKMRQQHLVSKWTRQKPTLSKVQNFLVRSKWTGNCISAEEVVESWTAPSACTLEDDQDLIRHIKEQSWKGLVISESRKRGAGRGVFATKAFAKGSVVCDYHGKVVGAAEGMRLMELLKDGEDCYIFFFKAGEQDLCVNSQSHPCECHPHLATYGRMINHSAKAYNVRGIVSNIQGQDHPVFLMKATRDIKAGEELYIDYGVRQRSFSGEAMGLSWLDE